MTYKIGQMVNIRFPNDLYEFVTSVVIEEINDDDTLDVSDADGELYTISTEFIF
jgi:hypothetical protein